MPVLVGAQSGQVPQILPDVGFCVATWQAPDGTVWPLMSPDTGVLTQSEGVTGLGAAAIGITTDSRPRGGVRVRHIQPQQRLITWPLYVFADTHAEFTTLWRAVAAAFTDTSRIGPGTLEIARPDGTTRQVDAFYEAGFDGSGKQGYGITSDYCVITLMCEDPYWRDAAPTHVHRAYATGVDYLVPYPSVSSAQVLGQTDLFNPGDAEAWPSWTITGPGAAFTATLLDTGEAFTVDPNAAAVAHGNLTAGQYVTVDTDPPRVRYMDGSVWTGALNWPGAVLWALPPGHSTATFALTGASAGAAVDLSYYARYETA
jgi:hypothetical protein